MPLLIGALFLLIIFGPQLWVRYVLKRYHRPIDEMPGTGGELARHLLDRFELSHVKLETCDEGQDHYDPKDNCVRLSPSYFYGKSLTSIAVAAHEVGHAIQFNRNEPVSQLRKKYLDKALTLQRIGSAIMVGMPLLMVVLKTPLALIIGLIAGVTTLLISVLAYAAILPEEWDASFNKALPTLKDGGYLPERELPKVRTILTACALTYVAAALASILNLWRWLYLLRGLR